MTKEKDYSYKEFSIAKKSGKTRKICNPSPDLKRWQRFQLKKLNKLFAEKASELDLPNTFHGFLPNRNAVTAAACHIPFQATIMLDIRDFFDSVTRRHVDNVIKLDDHFKNNERFFHKEGYTAQGMPSSPLLANIALLPAMSSIVKRMEEKFGKGNYTLTCYADDIQASLL